MLRVFRTVAQRGIAFSTQRIRHSPAVRPDPAWSMEPGAHHRTDTVRDWPFVLLIGFQRFDQRVLVRVDGFVLIIIGKMFFRPVQWFLLIGFTMIGIIHGWRHVCGRARRNGIPRGTPLSVC